MTSHLRHTKILTNWQESPFTTALEHSVTFLRGLQTFVPGIEGDLLRQLSEEQTRVREEINRLRIRIDSLKIELESLWKGSTDAAYELTSVFIHRGSSPSWGHYFFYSRHLPDNPDFWFKYNDSDVCVVSKDEVLADTTGSTANPYLVSRPQPLCMKILTSSQSSFLLGRAWMSLTQ